MKHPRKRWEERVGNEERDEKDEKDEEDENADKNDDEFLWR